MRISDWSSDVCSSDLARGRDGAPMTEPAAPASGALSWHPYAAETEAERRGWYEVIALVRSLSAEECVEPGYYRDPDWSVRDLMEIGRASCRERMCQYV